MNATTRTFHRRSGLPPAQGLYDPRFEHESCGVGFVCNVKGRASRGIVDDAKHINCSMDHRGGIGYEPNTGDGAGILTSLPHGLLARVARETFGRSLPEPGRYGVGNVFLPHDATERRACKERIEAIIAAQGQVCLGWRALPVDAERADLGSAAVASMPHMEQLFVAAGTSMASASMANASSGSSTSSASMRAGPCAATSVSPSAPCSTSARSRRR